MSIDRPQRILPTSPIGTLLKSARTPARLVREAVAEGRAHLSLVRQPPCLKCGSEPCEAAHVRFASAAYGKASGLNKKPEDRWALPLTPDCHRLAKDAQHNRNEQAFWHELDLNPLAIATDLWACRGDFPAMQMVIIKAIKDRRILR